MGSTHFESLEVGTSPDSSKTVADSSGYLYQVDTKVTATATELSTKVLNCRIDDISGANTAYVVSPFAGTLSKVWTVVSGDPGADTVLTANVNGGTDVTATVTVADASSAGDVDSCTPADNNTVTAGNYIKLTSDGAASNAVSVDVTFVITL